MTRCMRPARRSRKASCRAAASRCCAPARRSSELARQNDDQKTGVEIVRKALSWPARQIALNAGEDGSIVVGKILEKDQYAYGFDAQTGEYGNLMPKGIIDPTKVVRAALQGAASVAGLLITTEAMVAELPKKKAPGDAGRRRAAAWAAWTTDRLCSRNKRRGLGAPFSWFVPECRLCLTSRSTLLFRRLSVTL